MYREINQMAWIGPWKTSEVKTSEVDEIYRCSTRWKCNKSEISDEYNYFLEQSANSRLF